MIEYFIIMYGINILSSRIERIYNLCVNKVKPTVRYYHAIRSVSIQTENDEWSKNSMRSLSTSLCKTIKVTQN